jgi:hypothetical protein
MAIQKKIKPVRLLCVAVAMWLSACSVHAQQKLLISGSLYVPTLPLPSLHLLATDLNPFSANLSYTVNRYQISPSNVVLVVSYC